MTLRLLSTDRGQDLLRLRGREEVREEDPKSFRALGEPGEPWREVGHRRRARSGAQGGAGHRKRVRSGTWGETEH